MASELERYIEVAGGDQDDSHVVDGNDGVDEEVEEEESGGDGDEDEQENLEGDVGEEDVEGDVRKADLHDEVPTNDRDLTEKLDSLSFDGELSAKQLGVKDYGLVPFDLPSEHDNRPEKVRTKKKATGWAI